VIAVNIYIKDKIKSKKALIPYPSYKKGSLRALISFFENLISISLSNAYFNESSLPYTVDLIQYHTLKNDSLKAHIDRVGKVFYQRQLA
jgi:hypothetical protein